MADYTGWLIRVTLDEAGLGDTSGINVEESLDRFAEVLEATLVEQYPGAEIEVSADHRTYNGGKTTVIGPEGSDYPTRSGGYTVEDDVRDAVGDIAGDILSRRADEWVVDAA